MMIWDVSGAFSGVGTVIYDPDYPSETVIDAVMDATTFNTIKAHALNAIGSSQVD